MRQCGRLLQAGIMRRIGRAPPRMDVVRTWRVDMSSSLRMGTVSGHDCSALTSELAIESCPGTR